MGKCMTANELADELDKSRQKPYTSEHLVGKAANMLRQFGLAESIVKQQALDIEEWKRKYKDMHNLATQVMSKVHQLEKEAQMNNEPVAWIPKGMTLAKPKDLTDCIPLYTHLAKELADELDILNDFYCSKAAEMLRQQQAEIEALKAEKIRAYDNGYEDGRKPNTNKAQEK